MVRLHEKIGLAAGISAFHDGRVPVIRHRKPGVSA
jgi:hypothetical protein